MAKVTRLNVMITASTKGLSLGINKAQGMLNGLSKTARGMRRSMDSAFTGLVRTAGRAFTALGTAAVAAGAGLAYLTKQSIDAVGDTNDFAKSLGLTYNQLKAVQFAAAQAGVDAGALDAAFTKMSDTLGTAFGGNAAAIKAFEGIGLSIADLQRMSPAQQFEAIANAINKIQDPSVKMAAARDIFGKSGGKLISLFDDAGQSIKDAGATLETFGVNLSQLDVEKIDKAGDAIGKIALAFEGIGNQLALNVAPYITKISEDTTAWLESMGGIDSIVDGALGRLGGVLDTVLDKTIYIQAAWNILKGIIDSVAGVFDMLPAPMKKLFDIAKNSIPGVAQVDMIKGFVGGQLENEANNIRAEQGGSYADKLRQWGTGARQSSVVDGALAAEERANQYRAERDARKAANRQAQQQQQYAQAPGRRTTWFDRMGIQDPRMSPVAGQAPGAQAPRDREDPALQVLRNIEANTGKNKIAFAG